MRRVRCSHGTRCQPWAPYTFDSRRCISPEEEERQVQLFRLRTGADAQFYKLKRSRTYEGSRNFYRRVFEAFVDPAGPRRAVLETLIVKHALYRRFLLREERAPKPEKVVTKLATLLDIFRRQFDAETEDIRFWRNRLQDGKKHNSERTATGVSAEGELTTSSPPPTWSMLDQDMIDEEAAAEKSGDGSASPPPKGQLTKDEALKEMERKRTLRMESLYGKRHHLIDAFILSGHGTVEQLLGNASRRDSTKMTFQEHIIEAIERIVGRTSSHSQQGYGLDRPFTLKRSRSWRGESAALAPVLASTGVPARLQSANPNNSKSVFHILMSRAVIGQRCFHLHRVRHRLDGFRKTDRSLSLAVAAYYERMQLQKRHRVFGRRQSLEEIANWGRLTLLKLLSQRIELYLKEPQKGSESVPSWVFPASWFPLTEWGDAVPFVQFCWREIPTGTRVRITDFSTLACNARARFLKSLKSKSRLLSNAPKTDDAEERTAESLEVAESAQRESLSAEELTAEAAHVEAKASKAITCPLQLLTIASEAMYEVFEFEKEICNILARQIGLPPEETTLSGRRSIHDLKQAPLVVPCTTPPSNSDDPPTTGKAPLWKREDLAAALLRCRCPVFRACLALEVIYQDVESVTPLETTFQDNADAQLEQGSRGKVEGATVERIVWCDCVEELMRFALISNMRNPFHDAQSAEFWSTMRKRCLSARSEVASSSPADSTLPNPPFEIVDELSSWFRKCQDMDLTQEEKEQLFAVNPGLRDRDGNAEDIAAKFELFREYCIAVAKRPFFVLHTSVRMKSPDSNTKGEIDGLLVDAAASIVDAAEHCAKWKEGVQAQQPAVSATPDALSPTERLLSEPPTPSGCEVLVCVEVKQAPADVVKAGSQRAKMVFLAQSTVGAAVPTNNTSDGVVAAVPPPAVLTLHQEIAPHTTAASRACKAPCPEDFRFWLPHAKSRWLIATLGECQPASVPIMSRMVHVFTAEAATFIGAMDTEERPLAVPLSSTDEKQTDTTKSHLQARFSSSGYRVDSDVLDDCISLMLDDPRLLERLDDRLEAEWAASVIESTKPFAAVERAAQNRASGGAEGKKKDPYHFRTEGLQPPEGLVREFRESRCSSVLFIDLEPGKLVKKR